MGEPSLEPLTGLNQIIEIQILLLFRFSYLCLLDMLVYVFVVNASLFSIIV